MTKGTLPKRVIETSIDKKKNQVILNMELSNMPKEYVAQAKKIDGSAYCSSCFGFQLVFAIGKNQFYVNKCNKKQVYYMDDNGDKHYMDYDLTDTALKVAKKKCNKVLQKMGLKKVRKSPSNNNINNKETNETQSIPLKLASSMDAFKHKKLARGQLVLI